MKYQKERCLQCDRLRRPKDLESKYKGDLTYGELDATGQFCETDYWFCSDKCYEEEFSKYLQEEYLPKYWMERSDLIAPGLRKAIDDLDQRYHEMYGNIGFKQIKPQYTADFRALVNEWRWERDRAVQEARLELKERVESEFWLRFNKDVEDFLEEDNKRSEMVEKTLAAIDAKDQLERERLELLKERPIPEEARFSGCWIVAPPGRGKTTLLHSMIMEDLKKDASIIVMDSKGDLINPIRELAFIADRLVIIDPHNPIALNPLDVPKTNVRKAVGHLEYIFSALLEAKITPKQQALFRSVLRALVIGFDNPTIEVFRDIISNGVKKYKDQIARLPPDLQDFFNKEFDRDYDATRNELIWRLRLLMENDFIRTMLNAPMTKLKLGREMDEGKVIIIKQFAGIAR